MSTKWFFRRGVGDGPEGERAIIALMGGCFYPADAIGLGLDVEEATVESEKAGTFRPPRCRKTLVPWKGDKQLPCGRLRVVTCVAKTFSI